MIATYLTICIRKSFSPGFSTTAVMLTSLHFLHNLLSRRKKIAALKTAALKAFQSLAFGKKKPLKNTVLNVLSSKSRHLTKSALKGKEPSWFVLKETKTVEWKGCRTEKASTRNIQNIF